MVQLVLIAITYYLPVYRSGVQHIEKLPFSVQFQLASLLLSAVVIDHDTKANGVLSCLLLNSILSTFQTVHREMQTDHTSRCVYEWIM